MLPSLVRTAEEGFEYRLYITHDKGDNFFDGNGNRGRKLLRIWAAKNIVTPLKGRGIACRVTILRFDNPYRKPGPVFNFMMKAAEVDGADYLYRINDDSEFSNKWAGVATSTLRAFNPPNMGVVGPICRQVLLLLVPFMVATSDNDLTHSNQARYFPFILQFGHCCV